MVDGLEARGLATHEVNVSSVAGPLGVVWNGEMHCTTLSPKRYWRVVQATRFALRQRAVPGWCWEILIGHLAFRGLIVRDCLSAFHSIYAFIRKHCTERTPLWASAHAEVQHSIGALVFMRADWWLPWHEQVASSDTSPFGFGICGARWERATVAEVGGMSERDRFRWAPGRERPGARERERELLLL